MDPKADIHDIASQLDSLDIYQDAKKFINTCEKHEAQVNQALEVIGKTLNSLHGTAGDRRYWESIIGDWARYFLCVLTDKTKRFELAPPELQAALQELRPESIVPAYDHGVYSRFLFSDMGRAELYKTIANATLSSTFCPVIEERIPTLLEIGTTALKRSIYKLRVRKNAFACTFSSNYFYYVYHEMAGSGISAGPLNRPALPAARVDAATRYSLEFQKTGDRLVDLATRLCSAFLPQPCIEHFSYFRKHAIKTIEDNKIKFFTTRNTNSNTFDRFLCAELSSSGGKIIKGQHGGGYGVDSYHTEESHERKSSDYYVSWGWNDNRGGKVIALPSIMISAGEIPPTEKKGILLVSTEHTRTVFRFQSCPAGSSFKRIIEMTDHYLQSLTPEARKATSVRPYHHSYGWGFKQHLAQRHTELPITDTDVPFLDAIGNAQLVVVNHLATSFLESMAHDIPTVVFYPSQAHLVREEAQPYFDLLEQAKILHTSPESAANHVNTICSNPMDWWKTPLVQQNKDRFVRRFAWNDKNYGAIWATKIAEIFAHDFPSA